MTVHELEQLRRSWSQVSEPGARAHAAARGRLDRAIQAERSPARGGRRRVQLAVVVAIVLGLLAAVPALSGNGYGFVIHWLHGTPSNEVREDVAHIDQGAPPGMAQHPIVGKTGLVYKRETPYGEVRIWLTPTKGGARFCEMFEAPWKDDGKTRPMAGGCFAAALNTPIEMGTATGDGTDFALGFINGRVAPWINRLELRYVNGDRDDVPLQGGFFVAVIEKTRNHRVTDHPAELIGYDRDGKQVATVNLALYDQGPPSMTTAPPVAETEQEHTAISVPLGDGTAATLSLSPSRAGGDCDRIAAAGTTWSWTCADPSKLPQPLRIGLVRPPIDGGADAATLLFGVLRPGLTLTARYEDGSSEQLPLTQQRFLVDLAHKHRKAGERLAELIVTKDRQAVLRVPIATRDETLYSKTADREPQLPMHQIQNPTTLPIVTRLELRGSHGERIEFLVRRETPTHWYEILSVDGTVVSGANLSWFPGGHDATIGLGWQPMRRPEFDVPHPLSLMMGSIREPATAARVVYADGTTEPLDLARPSEPVGHGTAGWFVYEMTPARRERKPVKFEALDANGAVVGTAKPPPGA